MNVAIALNGENNIDLKKITEELNITHWIASDGGYRHLLAYDIIPDIIIGDFDSYSNQPIEIETKQFSSTKDVSDGTLTLEYCLEQYTEVENIYIIGALASARLEHFYNNLISLAHPKVVLLFDHNLVCYTEKSCQLPPLKNCDYISLFSLCDLSELTIEDAKYNVNKQSYHANECFGLSNEFVNNNPIKLTFKHGMLMIFYSFKE